MGRNCRTSRAAKITCNMQTPDFEKMVKDMATMPLKDATAVLKESMSLGNRWVPLLVVVAFLLRDDVENGEIEVSSGLFIKLTKERRAANGMN